jgi:hypothetical protein
MFLVLRINVPDTVQELILTVFLLHFYDAPKIKNGYPE